MLLWVSGCYKSGFRDQMGRTSPTFVKVQYVRTLVKNIQKLTTELKKEEEEQTRRNTRFGIVSEMSMYCVLEMLTS